MSHTYPSLSTDLPEYKQAIHELRQTDAHFAKLLESYDSLSEQIVKIAKGIMPAADATEHDLKAKRVHLKDDLVRILAGKKKDCCGQCQ